MWSAPVAEKQLQYATDRIQQLEQALKESRARTQDQVQVLSSMTRTTTSNGTRNHKNSLSPLDSGSPGLGSARQISTNLQFHVGRGDNGAVVYNGPTSRFHVRPLDEESVKEEPTQIVKTSSFAIAEEAKRISYIEALEAQYSLLDNGCIASVHYRLHFERLGLNTNTCMRLLDIYWTWLQPLHNCVYRPCKSVFTAVDLQTGKIRVNIPFSVLD
jgi:hypothetical protein